MTRLATSLLAIPLALGFGSCTDGGDDTSSTIGAQWDLADSPGDSSIEIDIYLGSGNCDRLDDVEIEESEQSVHVAVRVRHFKEEICTANSRVERRHIQLDDDLGSRRLTGCRPGGRVSLEQQEDLNEGLDCHATLVD